MNFKLIVAVLTIVAVPGFVQAQTPTPFGPIRAPNPPKSSKPAKRAKAAPAAPAAPVTTAAAAQKVVKTIGGDKAKTQTYCDIGKLGNEIQDAEQKKDINRIDQLNKKIDEMATKLGPDYAALMSRLEDIDPNSEEALEVGSALESLDKLCAK